MTLSAQIFSLPIIINNFKILSLISPLANVMILPVFSFLLTLGLAGTTISVFFWPLGKLFFFVCYLFLKYIILVCHFLASFHWAAVTINNFNFSIVLIAYFFIFVLYKIIKSRRSI
jgi:competence protein ComEC